MIDDIIIVQPAFKEAGFFVAKEIIAYAQARRLTNFFGGSLANQQQGLVAMIMVSMELYRLGKDHTFDASVGRTAHYDLLIGESKFEVKSGCAKDPIDAAVSSPNFTAQVPKVQFDAGRGRGVYGYIFPIINRDFTQCIVTGWIESQYIVVDEYGNARHVRDWQDTQGRAQQSYMIPFNDLKDMAEI